MISKLKKKWMEFKKNRIIQKISQPLFESLAKDLLDNKQFYIDEENSIFTPTMFDNIVVLLKSQKGITIHFVRDRSCCEWRLSVGNKHKDYYPNDICILLNVEKPNFHPSDFYEMTRQVSKIIAENIDLLFEIFNEDNINNTIKKLDLIQFQKTAEFLAKDLISIGFKMDNVSYEMKHFDSFQLFLKLQDDMPIIISMSGKGPYFECRINKEQFLIKDDNIDESNFFSNSILIEDLLAAIGFEVPETHLRIYPDPVSYIKFYSSIISKNIDSIKNSLKESNISDTKQKVEIQLKTREEKWNENSKKTEKYANELLKNGKFKILPFPYTIYSKNSSLIRLKSNDDIYVTFTKEFEGKDLEISCRLGTEEDISTSLADILFAIDIDYPKHNNDFIEMIELYSKLIADNYDRILKVFDKENIEKTKRKMLISERRRWDNGDDS